MSTSNRYISRLPPNLSKVKLLILLTLLDAGYQFPRGWIESSKLLYLTNQKNFEKHMQELRDDIGCDIETREIGGEQCYRLRSTELVKQKAKPKPKPTIAESHKEALLLYAKNSCQLCGTKMIVNQKELQPDPKIPFEKGGSNNIENLQILCNECTAAKKRFCGQCTNVCQECPWAFPEEAGQVMLITLPADLVKLLKVNGISSQSALEKYTITTLKKSLDQV